METTNATGDRLPDPEQRRRWSYPPRRWSIVAAVVIAVLIAGSIVSDLLQPATDAGRMSDLRSYYNAEEVGLSSCTVGLHDSLVALQSVLEGHSGERATAEGLASTGEQSCSPGFNESLSDTVSEPAPRSLAGYGVSLAGRDLYTWAFPGATTAEAGIYRLLQYHDSAGSGLARHIDHELVELRSHGMRIQRLFDTAAARLHGQLKPFQPSITQDPPAALQRP